MTKSLAEIAKLVKGEVLGDSAVTICSIAGVEDVDYGEMTWAEKERFFAAATASKASAVLVPKGVTAFPKPAVRVENTRLAFAILLDVFNPPRQFAAGVHPTAVIGEGCKLGEGCYVGPLCIVEAGAVVGKRVVLHGHVYVGPRARVGDGTTLHAGVVVREDVQIGKNVIVHAGTVVGSDGYGFVTVAGKHRKIPQVGTVIIHDDCEIGASCTIDRATTGATIVGRGTKTDNLVQIAHNVNIGEDCLIVAQCGIAGSAVLANHVTLAGQAGIAGHLTVGENSVVAAKALVTASLPPGSFVSGTPARPHQEELRAKASLHKLPDLIRKVTDLAKRLAALESREDELDIE